MALNVDAETWAALRVVPLVQVAWADGAVQQEERQAILSAAKDSGVQPKAGTYPLIEHWLSQKPSRELLTAWEHYITALCQQLSPAEIEKLKHELLDLARNVARAAGGVLGLGSKISKSERTVLAELEKSFA
jgi:tellurite resistance protein